MKGQVLPEAVREGIVAMLATGASVAATARAFEVAPSAVRHWRDRHRATGTVVPRSPARPPRIGSADARLQRQIAAHPDASVREHRWHWEQLTGDPIGKEAMGNALRRHHYIRAAGAVPRSASPHTERPRPIQPPRSPTMRKQYSTDLTDAEWTQIMPLLPAAKTGGRPARDRREIVDAISYIVRAGCAWRMMPHDFPPWQTVYHYFRVWRRDGTWERVHDALREAVREQAGRASQPSAGIIDSQSARTTEKGGPEDTTAAKRSTDARGIWSSTRWVCCSPVPSILRTCPTTLVRTGF